MHNAIPDTTADMMKITGIKGDIHNAFALTEPKMKPAYPWRKQATGIPTAARTFAAFLSTLIASSLTSNAPIVSARYTLYFKEANSPGWFFRACACSTKYLR